MCRLDGKEFGDIHVDMKESATQNTPIKSRSDVSVEDECEQEKCSTPEEVGRRCEQETDYSKHPLCSDHVSAVSSQSQVFISLF